MASIASYQPVSVLVVDDEELIARSCGRILSEDGYEVLCEARAKGALDAVRRHRPDIVLTDLILPDLNGIDLLREIRLIAPATLILITTGFATVDSSVEATEAGAYDYLVKPFTATQLKIAVGRASERVRLTRETVVEQERERASAEAGFEHIVGESEAIRKVLTRVTRVAPTEASVFLWGQSGTGKELIARAIHSCSRRRGRPFVAVNCAALPDHLLESELFGHQKGAFTGADTQRRGLLETAAGGTFFLDEVSEMSLELQAKLLRVIQERKMRRVGGDMEIPIDVRWVSATNREPEEALRAGVMRPDLFFRLNVVPIRLPSLRERREDIPILAEHFLERFAELYDRPRLTLPSGAIQALRDYDWPGNVRELQNVVERMVSLSGEGGILLDELAEQLVEPGRSRAPRRIQVVADRPFHVAKAEAISQFEKAYLRDLLMQHHGNISQAARNAGIDRKTIHRMLTKYELDAIA